MLNRSPRRLSIFGGFLVLALISAGRLAAFEEPELTGVADRQFRHPDLDISKAFRIPAELPAAAASRATADLAVLGAPAGHGRLDIRGGRWAAVILSQPLVPGRGVGNQLSWEALGVAAPANRAAFRAAAGRAFRTFVETHAPSMRIDPDELAGNGLTTASDDGAVVQFHVPRRYQGVRVRDSYLSGVVNRGNLVLVGSDNWGDIDVSTTPTVSQADGIAAVQTYVEPFVINGQRSKGELILVPLAYGRDVGQVPLGRGYTYRLAWLVKPAFDDDLGSFEALVDAHSGELISFEDVNRYTAPPREVKGGVYPVTNDGIAPDGVEQSGWPMPFQDTSIGTTDTGGNVTGSGSVTATLYGPYVDIFDTCGTDSLTQSEDIDWGTSGGTDCTTPGFGGAGNTHASRTGFYELNKIIEMARGHLPGNWWLQARLRSNMNINNTCNAFWNGTVNFYRSGGGCSNTGEIAGIFDHEWGHGMDNNDANPGIASPSGEGIADIYAALRLNDSCIGRNFRGTNCSGFGDPCLSCTGVRDIDYLQHASGKPHDYTWSNTKCGSSVHCKGAVYSEAVWSLWKRKLMAAPYNMDNNTAQEVVTRLTFIGAGAVGTWFSGSAPNGGCGASSGYLNYLAADDDNGNLNDGTPHMTAIYEAFDDQKIACNAPTVQDSGCANVPTTAPSVTASGADKSVSLSWHSVSNATEYAVFRTEGVFGCDFGKVKLGETVGTTWNDNNLQNGRAYSYVVIPIGAAESCMGPASSCTTASPAAGPNLTVEAASAELSIGSIDADDYIDNCESATLSFDVSNIGLGALTNVRVTSVTATSHPSTTIDTSLPAAVSPSDLAEGAAGSGAFDFTAGGLTFGDTLVFELELTSDELSPATKTATLTIENAETDLQFVSSHTWDFETGLDGWELIKGTFDHSTSGGGANGSSGYFASSANLDNRCDQARSPTVKLKSTSELIVVTNYEIEDFSLDSWWDRANVAVFDNGVRNLVEPDGGRPYNASGAGGPCVTADQDGWANVQTSWSPSTWSASALGSAGYDGKSVRLDIAYGTDVALVGRGFWFDQVTLTNFESLVADAQSDSCRPPPVCGDGAREGIEVCDGADLNGATCVSQGCDGGTISCQADCTDFDMSNCTGCPTCNNNGICELGEDCLSCGNDCISGSASGAFCGNGWCEAGDGEDCLSCPADCNGVQNGQPSGRFCCGDGDGQNSLLCSEDDGSVCNDGFLCTDVPQPAGSYCCGDNTCDGAESSNNCSLDCGPPPFCGDALCNGSEDPCSCAADCGPPPTSEVGLCSDDIDNDCDIDVDCADPDCGGDATCQPCSAGQNRDSCTLDSDCCSNKCRGRPGNKSCK